MALNPAGQARAEALQSIKHTDCVLLCPHGTRLNVYKGMLASHSKVFAEMFEALGSTCEMKLQDDAAAIGTVLSSLNYDSKLQELTDPDKVAAVLQIAHKYDMPRPSKAGSDRLAGDLRSKVLAPTGAVR